MSLTLTPERSKSAFENVQPTYESGPVMAASRKINSSKLREKLWEAFRSDLQDSCRPKGEAQKRFVKLFESIGSAESIERALLVALEGGLWPSLENLEQWTEKARSERGFDSFEDFFGSIGEDMRLLNHDPFGQFQLQVALGAITAGYRVVKGIVMAVPDLVKLVTPLIQDPEARAAVGRLYKEYLIWVFKLHFGTTEMKIEAAKQVAALVEKIWELLCASFSQAWEKARDEGREVEFVTAWVVQAGIEIPSAVLGAAKAAKLVKSGEALATAVKVTSKVTGKAVSTAAKVAEVVESTVDKVKTAVKLRKLSKAKYAAVLMSHAEVLETVGAAGAKIIQAANPRVQKKIMRGLAEFFLSTSKRGKHSIEGRYAFASRPSMKEKIIRQMVETLTRIDEGKGVDVYLLIKKGTSKNPNAYLEEALSKGFKGKMFRGHQKAVGADYRLGPGRYVTVGEYRTTTFEAFPESGLVPEGYAILKATFQPSSKLRHSFEIFPSVRQPGGGINIIDRARFDSSVFKNPKLVWEVMSAVE